MPSGKHPRIPKKNITSNCGGNGNEGGSRGDSFASVEGEDQDESSSSSSHFSPDENFTLEKFRKQWQRELEGGQMRPRPNSTKCGDTCKADDIITLNIEDKAKVLFQMGVENEEKGRLYEAIQYYRRAFQLVPDIEFKLSQQVNNRSQQNDTSAAVKSDESLDVDSVLLMEGVDGAGDTGGEDEAEEDEEGREVAFDPSAMDLLVHLQYAMQRSRRRAICSPNKPNTNCTHISALPMEIFLYILRWVVSTDLDLRSLEVCSQVCRGFYICCRDQEIWRIACTRTWGLKCGSIAPSPESLRSIKYSSWREMFIQRPHLQYGGCYISRTTYIRPGENSFQDQFYRPWHLVQYYRYLRFFPDGRVLMLTTVEDPATSVGLLRSRWPPQRQPPVFSGYFRLHDDSTVSLVISATTVGGSGSDRHQRSGGGGTASSALPSTNTRNTANSNAAQNHTFHLELEISNHKSRLHGKLVWRGYSAFTQRNGVETNTSFDLESSRYPPFWFSRVKSYTAEAINPLM